MTAQPTPQPPHGAAPVPPAVPAGAWPGQQGWTDQQASPSSAGPAPHPAPTGDPRQAGAAGDWQQTGDWQQSSAWQRLSQGDRQTAATASYTSPIPIQRTHLGHAIRSEWTKIRSVRSTMWTLGVFVVLVVGVGLLFAANTKDGDYANTAYTVPAFFGLELGQICLLTLGVLVITSEYGTGMIRTTFTASPRRHRVLAAKFLVFFCVSLVVSMLSVGLVGLLTSQIHHDSSNRDWLSSVFLSSLYVSLLGVLALAMGSILRHSAGAITTMLGLVLVPAIMPAFLMISESTRTLGNKILDYSAPNSLAKLFHMDNGTGAAQLWLLAGVTAAAIVAAFILLDRRDV